MNRNFRIFYNSFAGITVFEARTKKAMKWLEKNLDTRPWQWFGNNVYVNTHYAGDIIEAIENEF